MKTLFLLGLLAVIPLCYAPAADTQPEASELKVSVLRYVPYPGMIVVRIENRSQRPLKLLRPMDGSQWGWHMPIYDISITDPAGKAVPLGSRCGLSGLYANLKWPDDYRIQVLPDDAYEVSVHIARDLLKAGRYTFQFSYTYDPAVKTHRQDTTITYPDDLWVGVITSAPTVIEVPHGYE